ncbi:MAG: hypothetical protein KDB61_04185, partial [Planctomycetes bacterium]|nr:hypothetical protein [Planctomycetota bacterium]
TRAPEAAPRLGIELAAYTSSAQLTFQELDELVLRRNAMSQMGRAALREIIDLKVLGHLAQERKVTISQAQLNQRWAQIEGEVVATGEYKNMADFLDDRGVDRDTFREYLELSLIQETLVRQALDLPKDAEVNAETQKLWLESEMEALGYVEVPDFWKGDLVCTLGPITVTCQEFAQHLRQQLEVKDLRQACYEALLAKKILARFPDLSPAAAADAIAGEIELRRQEIETDPRYKGVKYEDLLKAQGITVETLALDPALQAAALSRLWVDRTCDDACLREFYESERENFDGLFGEGAETFLIKLNAAAIKNDLNPRTFEEAEATLEELRHNIHTIDDFKRLAALRTEEVAARSAGGLLGWVRGRTPGVDPAIRQAVLGALDANPGPVEGTIIGPLRLQGAVVLIGLGQRAAAPTWEVMSQNVHRELRRRFMIEQLPTAEFQCWLLPERNQ